ncbi:MAG: flagellar type III secretion system pore protein FliP [Thiohalophilus sp.]|uniref:flagellar type III secretion system pore protein FliP n=1 Tax=Thiohalophilus sp. TaxID=3028392 RepID=UPI00287078DE|nr:flagellar type III secretion system pore protein FliP [Thiohalophilus sp.]MDR9436659.1 flagellar type III secretion system pore protein FliP [Thiohalophilus sp.]
MKRLSLSMLFILVAVMLLPFDSAMAQTGIDALTMTTSEDGEQTYSVSLQIVALMTVLTLLPAALMMMTSFTRIIIVLAILRQALGLMQTPTTQTLLGLALFLTFFIMAPVFNKINNDAIQPYINESLGMQDAAIKAGEPLRDFMMSQTRAADVNMFASIAGDDGYESVADVPFTVLVPAFVTSELKTAFQIGFLLFIPFLIIDLVVASVLMSMGMMMLSPMIVSLPFKIMLFVLVDGWNLIMGTLASSFYV